MSDADTGLPKPNIWYILVDGNEATSCSTEAEKKEDEVANIEDEDEEDQKAKYDPYMTIANMPITEHKKPKKRKKRKRALTKKRKRKEV